jgi:outer membrane immunogenic protein
MKTLSLLGGAALAALALSATPAAAADFTGPRVEIHAGWDRPGVDDRKLNLDDEKDGIAYGAAVGYDVALGETLVAGVEAEIDLAETDLMRVAGNTRLEFKPKRDIGVSARVGARVGENFLVYAKAGYVNLRLKGAVTIGGTTGTTRTTFAHNGDGWRVGGGVEYAFADGAYAKAEYRYSDYEGGVRRHQGLVGLGFRF